MGCFLIHILQKNIGQCAAVLVVSVGIASLFTTSCRNSSIGPSAAIRCQLLPARRAPRCSNVFIRVSVMRTKCIKSCGRYRSARPYSFSILGQNHVIIGWLLLVCILYEYINYIHIGSISGLGPLRKQMASLRVPLISPLAYTQPGVRQLQRWTLFPSWLSWYLTPFFHRRSQSPHLGLVLATRSKRFQPWGLSLYIHVLLRQWKTSLLLQNSDKLIQFSWNRPWSHCLHIKNDRSHLWFDFPWCIAQAIQFLGVRGIPCRSHSSNRL